MDIGENIMDSIKYPLQDWVKILILMVISIIPIVNFMSGGYYLRIIKSTLAGVDDVPEFDDLGELFIDGIKMIIAYVVYMIVPLIIIIVGAFFAAPAASTTSYAAATMFTGVSMIFMIIGAVLAFIIGIIAVMGIANMAYYDSELGAAFRFSEIMERISAIGWGSYIIWLIVLMITIAVLGFVIGIVAGILMFILIGILVYFAGIAYLTMVQARSTALVYASSLEGEM